MGMYLGGQKISPIIKVSEINNQDKTITENGTYTADAGYTGLGEVTVNVSGVTPTGTLSITANGVYDVTNYASANVNVPSSGGIGIPREVVNGVYQIPSSSFTFTLPSNATSVGAEALREAFYRGSLNLTSVDLSSLITISSSNAMYRAFYGCTGLTSIDLSSLTTISGTNGMSNAFYGCINLTSVNLPSLTTISSNGMSNAFRNCTNLTSVNLPSLTTISGDNAMGYTFYGCTKLKTLSFPLLNSNSFGTRTNQFYRMLYSVQGCIVHFPSNLQSVIGSWSDVTDGFGGTNTVVLFDLPATT